MTFTISGSSINIIDTSIQCCIYGFGGVRIFGDKLRIIPKLPNDWEELSYKIYWENQLLTVKVLKDIFSITNLGEKDVSVLVSQGGDERIVKAGGIIWIEAWKYN